jgi:hypothetical protein
VFEDFRNVNGWLSASVNEAISELRSKSFESDINIDDAMELDPKRVQEQ